MEFRMNKWQQRFYLESALQEDDRNHLGFIFGIKGFVNIPLLKETVNEVTRHETFLNFLIKDEKIIPLTDHPHLTCFTYYSTGMQDLGSIYRKPYDFGNELPLRIALIKDSEQAYTMVFAFHHICIDGKGIQLLLNRISETYCRKLKHVKTEPEPEYPDNRPSAGDYLRQEKESASDRQEALRYWETFFTDIPTGIPFTFPAAKIVKDCGKSHPFQIGVFLKNQLDNAARTQQTSPFRLLLTAWTTVLARFSGNREATTCYTVDMRPKLYKNTIGSFINTLPHKSHFDGNTTLHEAIRQTATQRSETRKYQNLPLTDIVAVLRSKKQINPDEPLFNTGINYADWGPSFSLTLEGTSVRFIRRVYFTLGFDLFLDIDPSGEGNAEIRYSTDFSESLIRTMAEAFIITLQYMACSPTVCIARIPLLTPERLQKAEDECGHFTEMAPMTTAPWDLFRKTAEAYAENIAISYPDAEYTYRQLDQESTRIALSIRNLYRRLYQERELPSGTPIGICMKRNSHYIAPVLGIMKAGGAYVPLIPEYPAERLRFMAADAGISLLVTQKPLSGKCGCYPELFPEEPELYPYVEAKVLPQINTDSDAYIIYTSGTSGNPKGTILSYRALLNLIATTKKEWRLAPGTRQLHATSISFDVSVWEIFCTLFSGATLCVATEEERKDPGLLTSLIRQKQIDTAFVAPVMLSQLDADQLPGIRLITAGGESTPYPVFKRWMRPGTRVYNAYGPTESCVYSSICEIKKDSLPNDIGLPLDNVTYYVVDEFMNLIPDEVPGELYIGGVQLASGYLNRPSMTSAHFITNPFQSPLQKEKGVNAVLYKTGDWVKKMPGGHVIYLGRNDRQVKIRGFRVELEEIQKQLECHPEIEKSVLLVRKKGETNRLIAYLQTDKEIDKKELRDKLRRRLPEYMIPDVIVLLKKFPVTPNGKTDIAKMPEPSEEEPVRFFPRTPEEEKLASVAAHLLGTTAVDVETNLFQIGMNSLLVMIFAHEAAQAGIPVSVGVIYKEQTIRRILAYHINQIARWYTPINGFKKIAVIVCGHTDFGESLQLLAEKLSNSFSVIIIESYHLYTRQMPDTPCCEDLINLYTENLSRMLPRESHISLFTGHCFGGELAYMLANEWVKITGESATVWMFNSSLHREILLLSDYISPEHGEEQTALLQTARQRECYATPLFMSRKMQPHTGETILFTATEQTPRLVSPALPGINNPPVIKKMYSHFGKNPASWKKFHPGISIIPVHANHWNIVREATENILSKLLKPE